MQVLKKMLIGKVARLIGTCQAGVLCRMVQDEKQKALHDVEQLVGGIEIRSQLSVRRLRIVFH